MTHEASFTGPLPTGLALNSSSPTFWKYALGIICPAYKATRAARRGSGFLVTMRTVYGSGVSIRSMVFRIVLVATLAFGSYDRSKVNLTSAEVSRSPLWNLTPWRSLNCQVVGLISLYSVASEG